MIPFVNLVKQCEESKEALIAGFEKIIDSGGFVGGPFVAEFEAKFSSYHGASHTVGCASGTDAVKLALLAAGLKPGGKVIVPANSFIATANSVVHAGGEPVFVDCDPETYLLDLNQVSSKIEAGGIAFVSPVHLYGNPCDMRALQEICESRGVGIIEDNAQAVGGRVDGRRTGTFGVASGTSFYPAKNLGACGQGGAVVTDSAEIEATVRSYAEQGTRPGANRYHHEVIGYNDRLHSVQAMFLLEMMKKLDQWNESRRQVAAAYRAQLPEDRLQKITPGAEPVYHLLVFRCDSSAHRDAVADKLKASEIGFGMHYPVAIHRQEAYAYLGEQRFPAAEESSATLISLPMNPFLGDEQVKEVCVTVLAV